MRDQTADPQDQHLHLADAIEQNIQTLFDLHERTLKGRSLQNRLADAITDFSGRMSFVYLHLAWFGAWIVLNTGLVGVHPFDPFPYGLLTMIVSLEAIFLSAFVLLSQNRQSDDAGRRADLALQIGLLTEHELTHALRMLHSIQTKLGIDPDADRELAQLELDTRPEDVLSEIARIQKRVHHERQAREE